jgi:hypothetical protein
VKNRRQHDKDNFPWILQLPAVGVQAGLGQHFLLAAYRHTCWYSHEHRKQHITISMDAVIEAAVLTCTRWCASTQDLRSRVLALRAFNLETLLIGEHVKSREPGIIQIR